MNQSAATFLRMAEHNLNLSETSREASESGYPTAYGDHALISILMSAAAIESAITQALLWPIVYIENERSRRYLVDLLTNYTRFPIHTKIRFLARYHPELRLTGEDEKALNALISARNCIIHSCPSYSECDGYDARHFSSPFDLDAEPMNPGFTMESRDSEVFDGAAEHFEFSKGYVALIESIRFDAATLDMS